MTKKKLVCSRCNSEFVQVEAYVEWSVPMQCWVVRTVFDDAICLDCDGETALDWKEISKR